MGRKNKYESHVKPHLDKIKEWIIDETEAEIADELGISSRTFERYKKEHPELQEALEKGKKDLVKDLKRTLRKKAHGFFYTETKTMIRETSEGKIRVVEEFKRYAQPDTGAAHLLLKNLDPEWRNDDQTTIDLKKEKLRLEKEKAENNQWS